MNDLYWSAFEKSGSIDAFLAYRDAQRQRELTFQSPEQKLENKSSISLKTTKQE